MGDTHERFMKACIDLAKQATEHGDPPFGSVLVRDGQVILKGHNTTATEMSDLAPIYSLSAFCTAAMNLVPCVRGPSIGAA
jgi:tRNA(Arg) A34 adenosine deaminase TadA